MSKGTIRTDQMTNNGYIFQQREQLYASHTYYSAVIRMALSEIYTARQSPRL